MVARIKGGREELEKRLKCTKEIAYKVFLMVACDIPLIGKPIENFSQSDLIWAERLNIKSKFPLWALSKEGSTHDINYIHPECKDGFGHGYYGSPYYYCGCGLEIGISNGAGNSHIEMPIELQRRYNYGWAFDGPGQGYGNGSTYGRPVNNNEFEGYGLNEEIEMH